ncbi:unnamed protein product [Phaeothamnion confervicola]
MPITTRRGLAMETRSGHTTDLNDGSELPPQRRSSPGPKSAVAAAFAAAAGASPRKKAASKRKAGPSFHYEFGGPFGAFMSTLLLPMVVLGLYYACSGDCCLRPGDRRGDSLACAAAHLPRAIGDVVTQTGCAIFVGWMLFQVALERLLPGPIAEGVLLRDGTRLPYKLNGHLAFWVSLVIFGHCWPQFDGAGRFTHLGSAPFAVLYDRFVEIAAAACLFSYLLAAALYAASLRPSLPAMGLAAPGSSGNPFYDFWMGRELNPRLGPLDLKFFCELRPGLIGWLMLDIGMAAKQLQEKGAISAPMALVVFGQGLYTWDALYHESAILTTMDITTDGFGFMLAFGDLAWVPFVYATQARYLVSHDPGLPTWACVALLALQALGYTIFRGANGQKDAFRRDPAAPAVAHLSWMPTRRGTKLLTSGWWGLARKINYTGDWLLGLSWCLLTGFAHPVPYFYATYFAVLLVHRALRDDRACAEKYGADWAAYKKAVPAMFVPGVV